MNNANNEIKECVSINDANDFLNKYSKTLLASFERDALKNEVIIGELGRIKSLTICITTKIDAFKSQVLNAKRSMELSIYAIRSMGFKIIPIEINWHNVFDSDCNIRGDLGFFALHFKYEKNEN